jgi:2-polyprenyl-3-methyl-5-hydroxy-6-metoxy-1,4-benzoquinol methylase
MAEPATEFRAPEGGSYYTNERPELVAELSPPLGRVLDVGCGAGGVGRSLRAAGAVHLTGVEVNADAAAQARSVYDELLLGDVQQLIASGTLRGPFDLFALYDVLEHLVDPAAVLDSLRPLAAPGARLHVSVPNARHVSLLRDLILRGTFGYTAWGHRDASHLRWFTRRDIEELVVRHGWRVERSVPALLGRAVAVDRLTLGRAREFIALQWHVHATLVRRGG